jgi:NAD(P)H-nitrite reductase large subunit
VTDRVLCEAIASGAESVEALGVATKAGTGCGSCKADIKQLITLNKKSPVLEQAS